MNFHDKLKLIIKKNNSLVCVGLDTDLNKIPNYLKEKDYPLFEFNKHIIDATHDLVCAFKPNSAYYEALGDRGIHELKMTCDYLNKNYPEVPIILDAKRADIDSTNNGYVTYAFEYLDVDAITLNPYLGSEALRPFLRMKDRGLIILGKTSNQGAGELQDLRVNGEPLYKIVARKTANEWNKEGNCLLVVGATYPEELKEIRAIAGDMTFLVPGVGAQGGDVGSFVEAGLNSKKAGMIINSSRGIIYKSNGEDFSEKAREETEKLRNEINKYRNE